ncbi:MAG: GAF domain-containing protein [Bacteroidales bacterium]|nr:GAF domain-containing protein [Bacteroidales bacterium]MBN2698701.1 GAF domain-containing protein [Bacteroidales bacterium]
MHKLKYLLTWVALFVMILDGLLMVILTWNRNFTEPPSPVLMILLWCLLAAATIYLFFFAARQTLNALQAERQSKPERSHDFSREESSTGFSDSVGDDINVDAKVRKILRGVSGKDGNKQTGAILLQNLSKELDIMSGLVYFRGKDGTFRAEARFAIPETGEPLSFREGEGLTGQAAKNRQVNLISDLPAGYIKVSSGLGSSQPAYLAIIPVLKNNQTRMIIECSGFRYKPGDLLHIFQLVSKILSENSET